MTHMVETDYSRTPPPPPQLRGRNMKTYFQMYCFESTFLKHVAEEWTFCWKVLLVALSKTLVATITEFLSLFGTIKINIYIQNKLIICGVKYLKKEGMTYQQA